MNITEIKNLLDSNSVNKITNEYIELTYDLGDADDAGRFESKFEKIAEDFKSDFEIGLDILCDQTDYEEEGEPEWNIGNATIIVTDNIDYNKVKEFIELIDYI